MLASNILDLTHLNSSKNYRQERSVDTYRASCGTLNAKWTNNSFFSLEKKRCVNHQVGPDSHFHQGRLSEDTETLLLFQQLGGGVCCSWNKKHISNCKSKETSPHSMAVLSLVKPQEFHK